MIDSHVHAGDWKYFRTTPRFPRSAAETIEGLRKRGFSGAVIMPSECNSNEQLLREIRPLRSPAMKLFFLPWIRPEQRADLDFLFERRGEISGIKIHPSLDRTPLTDASYRDALSAAEDLRLPVLVHCGRWVEVAGFEKVIQVAEERPGLVLIMAHMGGDGYELKLQAAEKVRNSGLGNIFMDISGTHEGWLFETCVATLGADRFLMGSDWPIREPLLYPALVRSSGLTEKEQESIMASNALRLFGGRES
jgi:predicted TIM-barrel fold metal-dependent hydrolase